MNDIMKQFFQADADMIGEAVVFTCFDLIGRFEKIYRKNLMYRFNGYYKGITLAFGDRSISIIYTGGGASRVGDAVLALENSNARIFIYTGTVGGLSNDMKHGEFVIPTITIPGEGFTWYYKEFAGDVFESPLHTNTCLLKFARKFTKNLPQKVKRFHFVHLYTIESLFAETEQMLDFLTNKDISAIDMESSAFYTAVERIKGMGLAMHYISDLPIIENNYNMFRKECMKSYLYIPYAVIDFITRYWEDEKSH